MNICKNCHSPTHANSEYCLACCIEARGQNIVDWALEMRFRKFQRFSLPALVNFYEDHKERIIITGLNYKDPAILAGLQQVQKEMPALLAQYRRLPRGRKNPPQTSENPRTKHHREGIAQLKRQWAELQNGRCAYCDMPLLPDYSDLDTVLPVAMIHGKVSIIAKHAYFQIMALTGNVRVACSRCNFIKGRAEQRAIQFLQQLKHTNYEVQLPLALDFKKRGPRDFFDLSEFKAEKGCCIPRRMQHVAWEKGCAVANQAALRATMPCYHRPRHLLVSWKEDQKHLTLGCPKCADASKAVWEIAVGTMKWRHGDANGKVHGMPEIQVHSELPLLANGSSIGDSQEFSTVSQP